MILKMLEVLNQHTKLTGLDKTDQGVLDGFNELYRIHGPPSPSTKASSAKEMKCWLKIILRRQLKASLATTFSTT